MASSICCASLVAASIAVMLVMVGLGVPHPAMAARSLGGESVEPEWPCCRQYDTPPAVLEATQLQVAGAEPDVVATTAIPLAFDEVPAPTANSTAHTADASVNAAPCGNIQLTGVLLSAGILESWAIDVVNHCECPVANIVLTCNTFKSLSKPPMQGAVTQTGPGTFSVLNGGALLHETRARGYYVNQGAESVFALKSYDLWDC